MRLKLGLASIAMMAAATGAQTTAPAPTTKPTAPPAYTPVRWNEDYSYLSDPAKRADYADPVKYIGLGAKDFYLSVGGQIRERYEYFDNNNFGAGPQDNNGYLLSRYMLHIDMHATKHFRAFVQGRAAYEDGREGGPRPTDQDATDLQQYFADLKAPLPTGNPKDGVMLRYGRQDLIYGAQRLISPLDWTNVRRTFEGGKVSTALGKHTIDAFYVRPVVMQDEEWNNVDEDSDFWGVYDTILLPGLIKKEDGSRWELYGLGLNRDQGNNPLESDTYTIGTRFYTNPKPWDLDVELDYQFGDRDGADISAWSFAIEGGYTFANVALKPRTYLGFDIASGDQDATDGNYETFNQLFPLGHAYFGYIDVIGRQNIIDLHPGVELALIENQNWAKKLSLRTDYHMFWRQSDTDAVYNAGGAVLRADGGSDALYVGSEIDLLLNWQIDRHMNVYVGYSHFFAGDFIEETGPSEDIDFVYAAFTFTF
jgi:hypothetical protein